MWYLCQTKSEQSAPSVGNILKSTSSWFSPQRSTETQERKDMAHEAFESNHILSTHSEHRYRTVESSVTI